ncbi:MAG: cytochrome c biogenesis protein CcdA [Candidatus Omnitrophota bacterium]
MNLSGNFLDYPAVFAAGVLVSFSPCVFPLIPVTLGYIGARRTTRAQSLGLSLLYVLGLAVTYSILGLIAALTGKLFGRISVDPLTQLIVGNIFILLGLSFLGVFDIPVFGWRIQNKITIRGEGSVFLFGMVSGLVVGPCTAPALGAVLVYAASRQNLWHAASLLFTFAYGVGAVLIITAVLGGALLNLFKSGVWLERVKKAGGLLLIAAGEYCIFNAGGLW